jgi:hypothetical protein
MIAVGVGHQSNMIGRDGILLRVKEIITATLKIRGKAILLGFQARMINDDRSL